MAYKKAFYDITKPEKSSEFANQLGLKNLGMTIFPLQKGEGFDFFHNHREQEEVYFCLVGTADLVIREKSADGTNSDTTIPLVQGDIVKVDPGTLRAIGNHNSDYSLVLVAGAMPHTYPSGFGHHDVIADVLSILDKGETGFKMPWYKAETDSEDNDDDCC